MTAHFGCVESTAFKHLLRLRADEKKNFPTKITLFATFLRPPARRPNGRTLRGLVLSGANLSVFVVRFVSVQIGAGSWVRS